MMSSSKLTSIKPTALGFSFNYGLSKSVPVRVAGTIRPAKSYSLSMVKFSPDRITIYASKRLLDSISYISTEALNITNFSDTVSRTITLKKIHGVKCVPAKVHMTLYPDILTEESFDIPIKAINMPQNELTASYSVLRACALTYVAAALASLLQLVYLLGLRNN